MKVVVFDMDDTLYPEREYVRSGFAAVSEHVRERLGRAGFFETSWAMFKRGMRRKVFDETLRHLNIDADGALIEELVGVYRSHHPRIEFYPDARWALNHCRSRYALALISDGHLQAQKKKVEALGVGALMEAVYLTDKWGRHAWKPSAVAFLAVEEAFSAAGADCVYVGDNPSKDFEAPSRLGWYSVRVRREEGEHASASTDVPSTTVTIPSLYELPATLEGFWGDRMQGAGG